MSIMQLHQGLVDQKARHLALNTKIWESYEIRHLWDLLLFLRNVHTAGSVAMNGHEVMRYSTTKLAHECKDVVDIFP